MAVEAPSAVHPGEEADVESDDDLAIKPQGNGHAAKAQENGSKTPVEILHDDEKEDEDEGDEETFAVEKILNHRVRSRGNVLTPSLQFCPQISSVYVFLLTRWGPLRVKRASNFSLNGLGTINPKTTPGKTKKTAKVPTH